MNVDWGFAGAVVIVGLVVVFSVLLILVAFCAILGSVFKAAGGKKSGKEEKETAPVAAAKAPAPVQKSVAVEKGIGGEVIAAISAAISCMLGGQKFALRSVKRAKDSRPAWNAAGIAENTRPF